MESGQGTEDIRNRSPTPRRAQSRDPGDGVRPPPARGRSPGSSPSPPDHRALREAAKLKEQNQNLQAELDERKRREEAQSTSRDRREASTLAFGSILEGPSEHSDAALAELIKLMEHPFDGVGLDPLQVDLIVDAAVAVHGDTLYCCAAGRVEVCNAAGAVRSNISFVEAEGQPVCVHVAGSGDEVFLAAASSRTSTSRSSRRSRPRTERSSRSRRSEEHTSELQSP